MFIFQIDQLVAEMATIKADLKTVVSNQDKIFSLIEPLLKTFQCNQCLKLMYKVNICFQFIFKMSNIYRITTDQKPFVKFKRNRNDDFILRGEICQIFMVKTCTDVLDYIISWQTSF